MGRRTRLPALVLDPAGQLVDADIFESSELDEHWARLDEFEGPAYRRVRTTADTGETTVEAWIYVLADPNIAGST